jgi:transposase
MLVRYRYRIKPTPGQRQALARAFGCARVVYNDALAERRRAYLAGEKLSDTELQRRVVTLAKTRPERTWLAEVASVALVQACQGARRAYRNWFDSRSGIRKGRRVGQPRFRCKHGRQSIRLTRNGFALHGAKPYVAKVGEVRVRWSRALPSVPSSVTVLREPDGRFYASFVVEREPTRCRWPVPPGSTSAWPGWLRSPPATAPSSRLPTRSTCAPRSGNSPASPRGVSCLQGYKQISSNVYASVRL